MQMFNFVNSPKRSCRKLCKVTAIAQTVQPMLAWINRDFQTMMVMIICDGQPCILIDAN